MQNVVVMDVAIIGASLSEHPHRRVERWIFHILLSVVRISYVCLDCNLMQQRAMSRH